LLVLGTSNPFSNRSSHYYFLQDEKKPEIVADRTINQGSSYKQLSLLVPYVLSYTAFSLNSDKAGNLERLAKINIVEELLIFSCFLEEKTISRYQELTIIKDN
jgi:hypothetical protein